MITFSTWAGVLCIAGVLVFMFELGGTRKPVLRYGAAALCIALTLRYSYWRVHFSIPQHQNFFQTIWAYGFLLVEAGALLSSMLTCFFLSHDLEVTGGGCRAELAAAGRSD